jgi:hypothetical protein
MAVGETCFTRGEQVAMSGGSFVVAKQRFREAQPPRPSLDPGWPPLKRSSHWMELTRQTVSGFGPGTGIRAVLSPLPDVRSIPTLEDIVKRCRLTLPTPGRSESGLAG